MWGVNHMTSTPMVKHPLPGEKKVVDVRSYPWELIYLGVFISSGHYTGQKKGTFLGLKNSHKNHKLRN